MNQVISIDVNAVNIQIIPGDDGYFNLMAEIKAEEVEKILDEIDLEIIENYLKNNCRL